METEEKLIAQRGYRVPQLVEFRDVRGSAVAKAAAGGDMQMNQMNGARLPSESFITSCGTHRPGFV